MVRCWRGRLALLARWGLFWLDSELRSSSMARRQKWRRAAMPVVFNEAVDEASLRGGRGERDADGGRELLCML